ncbi:dTDP-4-dehydrorhamnose reductase [Gloeocapsa sp. PCC 73106]|uniref:dTDP-4-dehydrorhamnose reductase n=1 Tax=Gloeocapsa sp. PCC 73106 TaxID=102232 RepID=UPI0002ACEE58|nr:dTDP-4-dehydrorhamnose reductase [Gloeocapsa sp. PCC 73106]ELR97932.1 dTDP-4-dehydrorhamnose reductase [Gloeocapsa sp. PCC 73106]
MKKILLIGSQGQLGRELEPLLTNLGQLTPVSRKELDLTQPEAIRSLIKEIQPEIIVNAAAYTAVDKAESEGELADLVNGLAPQIMAETGETLGASLIHVSTDYVFDGTKNTPYLETDSTNPLGVYGRSKLLGEQGIQATQAHYLIVRTAWVYGTYGQQNFVKTMLRLGKEREELRIVGDQVGSPSWAHDIAQAIAKLTELTLDNQQKPSSGVYHFTNSGVASWYDFTIAIAQESKQLGFPWKTERIKPITTAEYPTPAQRPAYSVLSNRKLNQVLGYDSPYWRDSLRQMLAEFITKQS